MIEDAGVKLEKLPPYSPDFNPIEESFAELKLWIKKNRTLAEDFENFEEFLRLGLEHFSRKAGNHFRRAHIVNYP
jgi:transposase